MNALYDLLFIAFPYVAAVVFVLAGLARWRTVGYTVSSMSSQFLESDRLHPASLLFHWSLLALFLGHAFAFGFPDAVLALNSQPVRLIVHEVVGFSFGLGALLGLAGLLLRRASDPRLRAVTTPMDLVVELLLLVQIALGCWIALGYRWGSSWFAADLSPYLWSLLSGEPRIEAVKELPLVIQLHILGAFVLLALVPFSRLIHAFVPPLHYLARPYQLVLWSRASGSPAATPQAAKARNGLRRLQSAKKV
ncbi:MAG: respiratory nitrate reductase subunit gamma [Gammaproteobacteria bacterium]|nr:respiratory nitrate reductase subunit gamma [Gammaproteobacteria bacterium]